MKIVPKIVGLLLAIGAVAPTNAEELSDFYKDKQLTIVVGHEPGTGFDVYARLLGRHIGRHLPGNPNVIVQNMSGASGILAANWLYNIAPNDGTVIATFAYTVPLERLLGNAAAKFDPPRFTWIGNVGESVAVCGMSKAAGIGSFEDMLKKESVWGATGATGPLVKSAAAVKNLLGAKMKIVLGYKGSSGVKIAITRGEVHGICGLPMSTIRSAWGDLYRAGAFWPVLQLSGPGSPELNNLPHVDNFAKTENDRQIYGLIFGTQALGRTYLAPPGMSVARRNMLRAALSATLKDPQFLSDANKAQIDISPMTGEEVERFVARISSAPSAIVEQVKRTVKVD
jgi:tripartite-type tricarboxylate transporter receptor subunit TctC